MKLLLQVVSVVSLATASTTLKATAAASTFVGASNSTGLLAPATRKAAKPHREDSADQVQAEESAPLFLPPSEKAPLAPQVPAPPPPRVDPDPDRSPAAPPTNQSVGVQSGIVKKPRTNYDSWDHIKHANRDHWDPDATNGWGPKAMASSALFYQWFVFFTTLPLLVLLHHYLVEWSTRTRRYASAIMVIVAVAFAFMVGIRLTSDTDMAVMWATGFVLEILFSLENIFAFYVVIAAFKAPRRCVHKAIFTLVCFQIAFQMIFFMGLANMLRSFKLLPYLLGVWLVYGGVQCALDDEGEDLDIQSTPLYKGFVWFLGKRVHPEFDRHMVVSKDGKFCITLLGLLTLSLMVTDFLLEIDVTLTKIEEMDNQWVAFTSSAFAAFTVPQFIFIAQELFSKYSLLKYAVSFTLIFFGAQMIAEDMLDIPDVVGCGTVLCVLSLSIVASPAPPSDDTCGQSPRDSVSDAGSPREGGA